VKDKQTRMSKGVAFVLFLDRESAHNCCLIAFELFQLFGRTVKASIAIDNGRAAEFIRRRNYTDKSKCNMGEGHLSYACPKNLLGEKPEDSEEEGEDPALDSLSQAIAFQQARIEEEEKRRKQVTEDVSQASTLEDTHKPRIKKSTYFSDEEELSD
uniref:Zinc finger CCHC-type and RNA binding motif 1 n=1 Tax=Sinocyclocheilus rhinocerous TaxID=307959 RepID=A0A673LCI3_9TELE